MCGETQEKLENYTMPWWGEVDERPNCVIFNPKVEWSRSWGLWGCGSINASCPCIFDSPPIIHVRGFCPSTMLEHQRYSMAESAAGQNNIILVGYQSARIEYNSTANGYCQIQD